MVWDISSLSHQGWMFVSFCHRMLVYEYVNNGNLEQWLHRDVGPFSPLTWEIQMNIIIGTAKGYDINHSYLSIIFQYYEHLTHVKVLWATWVQHVCSVMVIIGLILQINLPSWGVGTQSCSPWYKIEQHFSWQAMESKGFRFWPCQAPWLRA